MKTWRTTPRPQRGFSLLELLLTVALIAILAALLLPVLTSAQGKARRTQCAANLKQIGTAFHVWAHEHNDKLPMELPMSERGTLEFAQPGVSMVAFKHFQALSNELVEPRLLVCPSDRGRVAAVTFGDMQNSNVSYLVNTRAVFGKTESVLAGDRNIRTSGRMEYTFLQFGPGDTVEWSSAVHGSKGNVLFGDAHVDLVLSAKAGNQLTNSGDVIAALPEPEVPPSSDGVVAAQPTATAGGGTPVVGAGSSSAAIPSPAASGNPATSGNPTVSTGSGTTAAPGSTTVPGDSVAPSLSPSASSAGASTSSSASPPAAPAAASSPSNAVPPFPSRERDMVAVARTGGDMMATSAPGVAVTVTSAPVKVSPTNKTVPASARTIDRETDDEVVPFAQWLGKIGTRFTYWLLFLLLAILVAIEIIRRRKKKRQPR